ACGDNRCKQEDALIGTGWDDRLLEYEFEQIGEGLQQAEGSNHVRSATHLHRRPHFAVGIEQEGDNDQQSDEQKEALPDDEGDGAGQAPPKLKPWVRAASSAPASCIALKLAMIADARAIGLVR